FLSYSIRRPPTSTRFPYTTPFRSAGGRQVQAACARERRRAARRRRDRRAGRDVRALRLQPVTLGRLRTAQLPDGLAQAALSRGVDRKSTRLNSSHVKISYAVFCLK